MIKPNSNQDLHKDLTLAGKNQAGSKCQPNQLNLFFENQLNADELAQFESHLAECENCRDELEHGVADAKGWEEARESLMRADESFCFSSDQSDDGPFDTSVESNACSRLVLKQLAPSDDPEMLGRLGPYEISGVIGQGGMGVVLKGYDKSLARYVALKVLAPHLAVSGAARQRFSREGRAAATVVHENVVAIHGVDESGELPFLVMPYVRGESLDSRIKSNGPLSTVSIVRIAMQISSGLSAAHAQGLVHRDIKPANIILEDGVERLLITDFGLARAVDDATLTRTGVISGTPEYMSPEQAIGSEIDTRSDLFSLGALMYAMCTGHSPFRAESSYGVLRRITDNQPRPIREINEAIPAWLEAFIFKLLSKKPQDRVGSAKQSAELLRDCLAHVQHPTAVELPRQVAELVPKKRMAKSKRLVTHGLSIIALAAMIGLLFMGKLYLFPEIPEYASPEEPALVVKPLVQPANQEPAKAARVAKWTSGTLLPQATDIWVSIPDFKATQKHFESTRLGEMFKQDELKPFVKSIKPAFGSWLRESEMWLGMDLFSETDWIDGEVSFAFSTQWSTKKRFAINRAVLIRLNGDEKKTTAHLKKVFDNVRLAGGVRIQAPGDDVETWTIGKKKSREIYVAKSNGWLTVCDHKPTVNAVLKKLAMPKVKLPESLAANVMARTKFKQAALADQPGDIQWCCRPIRACAIVAQLSRIDDPEYYKLLESTGFDVFREAGGRVRFATTEHEMIHRMFVDYHVGADPKKANVLNMFNFENKEKALLHPPDWVPNIAMQCTVLDWNAHAALIGIDPVYDSFIGEDGSFKRLVNDLKVDPDIKFDLKKFALCLNRRIVMFNLPVTDGATARSQSVFCIKIKEGESKFVMESLKRASEGEIIKLLGFEVIKAREYDDLEDASLLESGARKENLALGNGLEPAARPAGLPVGNASYREGKFFVYAQGHLIVARDKEVLKRVLEKRKKGKLAETDDYIQVFAALSKLRKTKNVGIHHFLRLDQSVKFNYELLRKGKLNLRELLSPVPALDSSEYDEEFEQLDEPKKVGLLERLDGKSLPADVKKHITPYLGNAGWSLENVEGGWLINGVILKK